MKIKVLGEVKVEFVSIREDFHLLEVYDSQQETVLFTRESTVMVSSNIFRDIMALYRVNTKM